MKPKMTVPLKQEVESETKWKLTQHYSDINHKLPQGSAVKMEVKMLKFGSITS